jgi:hypothetical protein
MVIFRIRTGRIGGVSLPMYPELTHRQIEFICEIIRAFSMATPSQAAGTTA